MDVDFQALAEHTNGVAYAALRIHNKFMRKDVQDFTVFGKRDVAGSINGPAHIFALNVARPLSQGDAAAAVYAAHVAAGYADQRFFHRHVCNAFGLFDGATDGAHRGIKIDDQAFAKSLGLGRAERQKLHQFAIDFREQHAGLRAADVQPHQVFIFLCQAAAPRDESILFLRWRWPCPRWCRDSRPLAANTANRWTAHGRHSPATAKNCRPAS